MSYRQMPVDDVLKACETYLEVRNQHLSRLREELIRELMEPRRFLGFTFGGKTFEQAESAAKRDRDSEYFYARIAGCGAAQEIERLVSLCQLRQATGVGMIDISAYHAHLLREFFG